MDAVCSIEVPPRRWSIKLPARAFSLHTIDISELRLWKAYIRSFACVEWRISLINDATGSEFVSTHQRGHPTMNSPKMKTAIGQKGLRCAYMERRSDPSRSQLDVLGRVRSSFRVGVCRNMLATSKTREDVRIWKKNLPTHERSKN